MILGATERLHPLSMCSARRIDVFGNRRRADKTDRSHPRIGKQGIDSDLVAMDNVEHPIRQFGLSQQIRDEQAGRRVTLGRLEDKGIATGQSDGKHPHRHHHGKVEGRNTGTDADRLTHRPAIDAIADLFRIFPFQQVWNAAGKLDDLHPANDFALGIVEHFAMLSGNDGREIVEMALK